MTKTLGSWEEPRYNTGRVEHLEAAECHRLLVSTSLGRLGYSTGDEQRIAPMNYVLAGNYLVVRTEPGNDIAKYARNRPVAFEVDEVDRFLQSGWSVLVCGTTEDLPADALRAMDLGETPEPWAAGVRSLYLRIPLARLSGRRIHPG